MFLAEIIGCYIDKTLTRFILIDTPLLKCVNIFGYTLYSHYSHYTSHSKHYIAEFLSGERSSTHCKMHHLLNVYVAVLGRNQTLIHCVFRSHCCIRSALAVELLLSGGSCTLCKLINTFHIYTARMCPALNKRSVL